MAIYGFGTLTELIIEVITLRVLFLHSYYCTDTSISGSRSHDLCKALIAKGHTVTVVCQIVDLNRNMFVGLSGFIKKLTYDGVDIYGIDIPYSNNMGVANRITSFMKFMLISCIKCITLKNIDVIFATSTPPTIAIPALCYKYIKRKPFIFELRDIWPDFVEQLDVLPNVPKYVFRFIDWCMIRIYNRADLVTTTTPGMTNIIHKKGIPLSKLKTILLGANINIYNDNNISHPILRDQILNGKFIVGFLGSISHGYGLQRLLDVAEVISKVNSNVAFLIIGRGGHFNIISEAIKSMGLENVYIGPAIAYKEVPAVLKNIHIGYESSIPSCASDCALDNKFYDYISAGLPILSNYDGDMGDLLRKWNCGFVAKNILDEVNFIDMLERNKDKYEMLSFNALNLAKDLDRNKQKDLFVSMIEGMCR